MNEVKYIIYSPFMSERIIKETHFQCCWYNCNKFCWIPGYCSSESLLKTTDQILFCKNFKHAYYIDLPTDNKTKLFQTLSYNAPAYTGKIIDLYISKSNNCAVHQVVGLLINITMD